MPRHSHPPGPVWLLHAPKNVLFTSRGVSVCTIWTHRPGALCCGGLLAYLWPCSALHGWMPCTARATSAAAAAGGGAAPPRRSSGVGQSAGRSVASRTLAGPRWCTAFFFAWGGGVDAGGNEHTGDPPRTPRGGEAGGPVQVVRSPAPCSISLSPSDVPCMGVGGLGTAPKRVWESGWNTGASGVPSMFLGAVCLAPHGSLWHGGVPRSVPTPW